MKNNDFFADRVIRADAKNMQETVDQAIGSGMDPEYVHNLIQTRFFLLGMATDIAEGEAFVQALQLPGRLGRALKSADKLLADDFSNASRLEEVITGHYKKIGGDPAKALPGPGQVARDEFGRSIQVPERPIPAKGAAVGDVGKGFILDDVGPGAAARPRGVLNPDVVEVPKGPSVASAREIKGKITPQDFIDVEGKVVGGGAAQPKLNRLERAAGGAQAEREAVSRGQAAHKAAFPEMEVKALPEPGPKVFDAEKGRAGAKNVSTETGSRPVGKLTGGPESPSVLEPGGFAEKFVDKQGAPRQYGKGGQELSVEAKRLADAAAADVKRKAAVKGAPLAEYNKAEGKLQRIGRSEKPSKAVLPVPEKDS